MNQPKISVIMAVYKEPESAIRPAIESILNQTFKDFEFILVNDNPTDPTTQKILEKIASEDTRISVITNDKNRGLGYSLNVAIKHAHAPLLARMDTEDISAPTRFEEQYDYMQNHPDVDLLFTRWDEQDISGEKTLRTVRADDVANIKKTFFTKSMLLHPTMLVRKQVLVDHPYPPVGRPEDFILFLDLIRLNYTFALLEKSLYTYMMDRGDVVTRYNKIRTYTNNYLPVLFKKLRWYWSNPYYWLYLLRVCIEFLLSRNIMVFKYTYAGIARASKKALKSA